MKLIAPTDTSANEVNFGTGFPGSNKTYDYGNQISPACAPVLLNEDDLDEGDVFWHDSSD